MRTKQDPMQQHGAGHLLFNAVSRLFLIRFVMAVSLAFPVLVAFLVLRMPRGQMILDFGSVAAGNLFQAGMIAFSGIFIYVMLWFSGKYVLRIVLQNGDTILITTWRIWLPDKTYSFHKDIFVQPTVYNEGGTALPFVPVVHAPYYTLRAGGKKFILDVQGNFPEGEDVVLELIGGQGVAKPFDDK